MYLLGAYIRVYEPPICKKIKVWHGIVWLIGICILAVGTYCFGYSSMFFRSNAVYLFAEMNKLPAIICAVLLFLGFKNWDRKQNLLDNKKYIADISFPVHIVGSIVLVFTVGIIIEWIRQYLEKNIHGLVGRK